MSHWSKLPVLAIDTETTGVSPFDDRIVEVACVQVRPDGVADGWSQIINPGVPIPDGAAEVHGITTDRARIEGADPKPVLQRVADEIAEHQATFGGLAGIVMFNARFDWPLLLVEAERHDVDIPATAALLDPMLIDKLLDKWRKGKRQLTVVADHYDVELGDAAHGAQADATAAGRVMHQLVRHYPQLRGRSLSSMWLRQVQGHETDRVDLEAYLRKTKHEPDLTIPPGWPIPVAREVRAS